MSSDRLLVVAGEASGDRAAAGVVRALGEQMRVFAFGLGGPAMAAAGVSLVADLRDTTAMGVGGVARHAAAIALSAGRLLAAAHRERVRVALLVNYSDFNARLAPILHARGVYVVWYGAPQVWAWRKGRRDTLRPHIDRMAVMLPFEEALWRERGTFASYVGHPACEAPVRRRAEARALLGLTSLAQTIAILPGSRPHEVRALLPLMLDAYERVRQDRASIDACLLLASSLDVATRDEARRLATIHRIATFDVNAAKGAGEVLSAFDVALTASGTATLEAALARAIPIVVYRVGLLSEAVARAFVRTPHYALPNVLLGRRAFPELLQRDATVPRLAVEIGRTLDTRDALLASCTAVEAALGEQRNPSRTVAQWLLPWLTS
jgi:lipid-A-disaccharide synthase